MSDGPWVHDSYRWRGEEIERLEAENDALKDQLDAARAAAREVADWYDEKWGISPSHGKLLRAVADGTVAT